MLNLKFEFDDSKVMAALQKLANSLAAPMPPPLENAFKRAGAIYLAFTRRRFIDAARGDGTWKQLALSTMANRLRKTKAGKAKFERTEKRIARSGYAATIKRTTGTLLLEGSSFEILRDTGLLLNSLSEGAPGNVDEIEGMGIRVGTRIVYAHFHQMPTIPGRPPQRQIIVQPPDDIRDRMTAEVAKGIDEVIKDVGLKG